MLVLIILITGCSNDKVIKKEDINDNNEQVIEEDIYVDDNPIVVGIYENDINLVKEYNTKKESLKDIIFSIFYSNEQRLENNNQKYNWNKLYNQYSDIDNYKIGFSFSFYSFDTKIEKNILGPDTFAFNPYFYIYLYDDIHQPDGSFYSHLENSDVTQDTIFSSIKIYLVDVDKITSPIEFTVFTYDGEEDFDELGNYRGNSKYTVTINLT